MSEKFKKIFNTVILPLIPMILWGSLFPMVKVGYETLSIDSNSIPDILMFAAIRFTLCGLIICAIGFYRRESFGENKSKNLIGILVIGFFSIILHYAFTYIGLSLTDSSKTAILKQLGTLFYICFAYLFIKEEKFSVLKIIGAVLGFGGIIAINAGGGGISFSLGDILIILASVCTVVASILTAKMVKAVSPIWTTGVPQLFGGIALLAVALVMGGKFPTFSLQGTLSFVYICTASIAAYIIWNYLMRTVSLSALFIIKFAEPMFACIFGMLLLGEDIFKLQYLISFLLISGGIIIGNREALPRGKRGAKEDLSDGKDI